MSCYFGRCLTDCVISLDECFYRIGSTGPSCCGNVLWHRYRTRFHSLQWISTNVKTICVETARNPWLFQGSQKMPQLLGNIRAASACPTRFSECPAQGIQTARRFSGATLAWRPVYLPLMLRRYRKIAQDNSERQCNGLKGISSILQTFLEPSVLDLARTSQVGQLVYHALHIWRSQLMDQHDLHQLWKQEKLNSILTVYAWNDFTQNLIAH